MYKLEGGGIDLDRLSINFAGDITYEIRDELSSLFVNQNIEKDFDVIINVKEELVPVIMNTNGTVSKYQIDIALYFEVRNKAKELIYNDVSVGFAQYDVLISEIENEDLKKQMTRSATRDAASLMIAKIQSRLSLSNDN